MSVFAPEKNRAGAEDDPKARMDDPTNAAILAVSEDRIAGFHEDPFGEIARLSNVPLDTVLERVARMLRAGTIRRVRQTLLATSLAEGALVAWKIAPEHLNTAFDFLFVQDLFSGHVVVRSTDTETPGAAYRLWTTLKVPQGFSLEKHCDYLAREIGADGFKIMPAKRLFALGVGHVRRRNLPIGSHAEVPAEAIGTETVRLSESEWQVLVALKAELTPEEVRQDLWRERADNAGVGYSMFLETARSLQQRGVIGRFSTFLEHVKPTVGAVRATRYNALFHWRVPVGREIEAGQEVGRFHIMTHAYWREGGPEFADVNIMGVAHGLEKERLLAHKAAMDAHLRSVGIPVTYTNVFWGGRSEIKPSEIAPDAYRAFCRERGLDPAKMRS